MAMEHKAFVFDFQGFEKELRPILEKALASNNSSELLRFIEANRASLKDPYEGEPLGEDWREMAEGQDPHQWGDFALTKYYEPSDDRGLGPRWEALQSQLLAKLGKDQALLGKTVGPPANPFDPGKMGSYFQSEEDVKANLSELQRLQGNGAGEADRLVEILRAAAAKRTRTLRDVLADPASVSSTSWIDVARFLAAMGEAGQA
jgi:hypothetical protein